MEWWDFAHPRAHPDIQTLIKYAVWHASYWVAYILFDIFFEGFLEKRYWNIYVCMSVTLKYTKRLILNFSIQRSA